MESPGIQADDHIAINHPAADGPGRCTGHAADRLGLFQPRVVKGTIPTGYYGRTVARIVFLLGNPMVTQNVAIKVEGMVRIRRTLTTAGNRA